MPRRSVVVPESEIVEDSLPLEIHNYKMCLIFIDIFRIPDRNRITKVGQTIRIATIKGTLLRWTNLRVPLSFALFPLICLPYP
jgi:hypothetical protein